MVVEEDFLMIEVSIPSMEREVDESGKTKKVRTRSVSSVNLNFCRKVKTFYSSTVAYVRLQ